MFIESWVGGNIPSLTLGRNEYMLEGPWGKKSRVNRSRVRRLGETVFFLPGGRAPVGAGGAATQAGLASLPSSGEHLGPTPSSSPRTEGHRLIFLIRDD